MVELMLEEGSADLVGFPEMVEFAEGSRVAIVEIETGSETGETEIRATLPESLGGESDALKVKVNEKPEGEDDPQIECKDKLSPQIELVVSDLENIISSNPGTPLADKLEDVKAKLQTALEELAKTPPDCQAAVGNLEGAVGDLEAAVSDELLDPTQGTDLMDQLAGAARQLAADALNQAIAQDGDPGAISDAEQALTEGDALRELGAFKDSVNAYKDALAKAESA